MNPKDIIHWLTVCSKAVHADECEKCPYNKDDYEAGCGKLLSDAALLLEAAYPTIYSASITEKGVEVRLA